MVAFDPLSYDNLGASIARALDDEPVVPLTEIQRFDGAGIYALYYTGDFPAYELLAERNREQPGSWALYIGKAEAENARKGEANQATVTVGTKLFNRVRNHRSSIDAAQNLNAEDFHVRMLAVAPTWIPLAEVVAIRLHRPVWNAIVDGLGNHNPGKGRKDMMRPRWDTLHPGRGWAEKLADRGETAGDIEQDVRRYLRQQIDG
ncbi:Eco29kI family restriction endonuclease [Corynebacterium mastitidis]|uniref:Eco29kI family restriction endonuclease n=1 Tax=Corynebacterium mastitidis TaxID=161890 RepID=UPI00037728E4|nr:Eco29kI family restriction endonuclease [Corynebacterium mastitidis]